MKLRLSLIAAATMIIALLPAAAALAQPPDNDDFADATIVTEIPFATAMDVAEATTEVGEPLETCAPFANTVWFELTLEEELQVMVNSAGSDYDTAIAVWLGESFDELANVACVDDVSGSLQAAVAFTAFPRETYRIQVGAFDSIFEDSFLELTIEEATTPKGPDLFKFDQRGESASAFFETFDEETGVFSYTEVSAQEFRRKVHKERPYEETGVFVAHYEEMFDPVTGEYTFFDMFGFSVIEPDQFDVDRKLKTGFVEAQLFIEGIMCTESAPEPNGDGYEFITECIEIGPELVTVDVTWEGDGPVFRSFFNERSFTEGARFWFRGKSTSREAMASGSVVGETFFADMDGAFGNLSRDSFVEMTIFKGGQIFM